MVCSIGAIIPQTSEALCIEQYTYFQGDDVMFKLCEQDELWEAIESIRNAIGGTTSNDNTASIVNDVEILASQNKILNEKITSLEATVANLEATVANLEATVANLEVDTKDCWFFC